MRGNVAISEAQQINTRTVMPVISLSLMSIMSAVVGLNIALPDIARATRASQTQLTWIVDAYTLVFAALLFFAGALGDRYGRKRLLAFGLIVFGAGSAAGAFVTDPNALIIVRAIMGLGAAAVMPTTLSIITTSFPEEQRPRAIAAWVGIVAAGAIVGLLVTAILLEYFAWHSFFWLFVVLAAISLIGALVKIPESVDAQPPAVDVVGGLLTLIGMAGLVFGVIEGPERGWLSSITLGALGIGVVALALFAVWELRRVEPLLDPRLFGNRGFALGSLAITVTFFCWFGLIFSILQYLQFVVGYSPLRTVACLIPLPFVLLPAARNAPRLASRVGMRIVVPIALVLLAAGLVLLSRVGVSLNYGLFVAGMLCAGLGMGLSGPSATTAVTEALPPNKQGVASAMNDTARELGAALGIAVLGSALNQVYRDGMAGHVTALPPKVADYVLSSISFTNSPELARFGERGWQLAAYGRAAFVDGVGTALLIAAAAALAGAIVVLLLAPRQTRRPAPHQLEHTLGT